MLAKDLGWCKLGGVGPRKCKPLHVCIDTITKAQCLLPVSLTKLHADFIHSSG